MCTEGPNCSYLHALPTEFDESRVPVNPTHDIFGRDINADDDEFHNERARKRPRRPHQDRANRTLYVNYEGAGHYDMPTLRSMLQRDFSEWGDLERIYVVREKTIAFIRYRWRVSAEFAREAMQGQPLRGSTMQEVLHTRWAHEDPNPEAVAGRVADAHDAMEQAIHRRLRGLPEELQRAQLLQAEMMQASRITKVADEYPDTDGQYEAAAKEQPADLYGDAAHTWQSEQGLWYGQDNANYGQQYSSEHWYGGEEWHGDSYVVPNMMSEVAVDEASQHDEVAQTARQQPPSVMPTGSGPMSSPAGNNQHPGANPGANALSLLAEYGSDDDT